MTTRLALRAAAALFIAALGACGRAGAPQGGETPGEIHFAVVSPEPRAADQAWRPILADMQARTGLHVTIRVFGTDAEMVRALRDKAVDAGLFSNPAAMAATKDGGGEVFARTDPPDAAAARGSVLIANAKRGLALDKALSCRRPLGLGMGEASSVPETLAPLTYLFAPRGIDPAACFKPVRVGSGSLADLAATAAGDLDLATIDAAVFDQDRVRNGKASAAVTVLWRSPPLPQDPVLRRKSLDPVVKEKLRQFFLTYGQGGSPDAAKARAALARVPAGGFEPADDAHLLPMREMAAAGELLAAKRSGDQARVEAAGAALNAATAQRQDLEARTGSPAAAQ